MFDRKQYLKEYHHNRWQNDPQYREYNRRNSQRFSQRFLKENGVSYQTYRRRQLKQEVYALREKRAQ